MWTSPRCAPSMVVAAPAVGVVIIGMLYLAKEKSYGRSDTGFELSPRARGDGGSEWDWMRAVSGEGGEVWSTHGERGGAKVGGGWVGWNKNTGDNTHFFFLSATS